MLTVTNNKLLYEILKVEIIAFGCLPEYSYESGRLMLFGTLGFVDMSIKELHRANYAEPNDWSRLLPTGQPNEVMSILIRRVRVD